MSCFNDGIKDVSDFFSGIFTSEKTHVIMKPVLSPTIDTLQTATKSATHVVRRGDTLSKIADKYKDVTYQEIAKANGITNPNSIYVGQRLNIPNSTKTPVLMPTTEPTPIKKPVANETSLAQNEDKCKCPHPKWMSVAKGEDGTKEDTRDKGNKKFLKRYSNTEVEKYYTSHNSSWTDDVPWCGSFVNWVMKKSGYKQTVSHPYRAKSWKNFGKKAKKPIYGAIAVKSRRGGGHVAFVIGQSQDGKYLYVLGGNQSDAVNIKKYKKSVWTDFRVPKDYDDSKCKLPVYKGTSTKGGKES